MDGEPSIIRDKSLTIAAVLFGGLTHVCPRNLGAEMESKGSGWPIDRYILLDTAHIPGITS